MKKTIADFLSNGCYKGNKYNANDFIQKLFFLKYLISDTAVLKSVYCNDNPFWLPQNTTFREELIQAVQNIKRFSVNDTAFFEIIDRFENGDAYGIRKPVPRASVEPFDEIAFERACAWYNISQRYKKDKLEKHGYYKLIFCYEEGYDYQDFESWTAMEEILETRINFAEYRYLDSLIYTLPRDLDVLYMSPEYCNKMLELKKALSAMRAKRPTVANKLVSDIRRFHQSGETDKAYSCYRALFDLFARCEGDSEEQVRKSLESMHKYLEKIPNKVIYDVTEYGKVNAVNRRSYV